MIGYRPIIVYNVIISAHSHNLNKVNSQLVYRRDSVNREKSVAIFGSLADFLFNYRINLKRVIVVRNSASRATTIAKYDLAGGKKRDIYD